VAVRRWIVLVLAAFLVIAAVLAWLARTNRRESAQLAQLSSENERLRHQAATLAQRNALVASAPAAAPQASQPPTARPAKAGSNPEDIIELQRLKLSLADANAAIARLQARLDEQDARIQNLTVDNKRLSASEADLKESLSTANQALDTLQKELKSKSDRVAQVEIAYQKLRDQGGADRLKIAELLQSAGELQEIHQRREVFLNSILRRYKQITEQYRSIAGVLQAQRTDAPSTGSADLARIQESIAMAEEDLRQLNSLNAQAARIQKKMAGR